METQNISSAVPGVQSAEQGLTVYAGFWKRLAAFIIDWVIVYAVSLVFGFSLGISFNYSPGGEGVADFFSGLLGIIITWVYFALMESSKKQGTVGKMALGIKVTDMNGSRISFGRATGRHFAKYISTLILFIGFMMIAFTSKKQGLHDILAKCLVVKKS